MHVLVNLSVAEATGPEPMHYILTQQYACISTAMCLSLPQQTQ